MTTEKSLEARILDIICELSAVVPEDIKPEDRLREDLGLDSVSSMELIGMLTEEFDIDVELEEAMAITDVKGVMEMAKRHIS